MNPRQFVGLVEARNSDNICIAHYITVINLQHQMTTKSKFAVMLLGVLLLVGCTTTSKIPFDRESINLPQLLNIDTASIVFSRRCSYAVVTKGTFDGNVHECIFVLTKNEIIVTAPKSAFEKVLSVPVDRIHWVGFNKFGLSRQVQFETDIGKVAVNLFRDDEMRHDIDAATNLYSLFKARGIQFDDSVDRVAAPTGPMYIPLIIRR